MKKLITILFVILLGGQLHAQKIGPDQLDQIKRLGRRNNHIEKTYEGTVEKLIYSFQNLGGALNGMIFRRAEGRLIYIRFYDWYGKSFKPYLTEGGQAEITVSGDPILLDVTIYKDDYFRELEFSMKEEIFGIADLKAVKTKDGSISIDKMDKELIGNRFKTNLKTVFNIPVIKKTALNKNEYLIALNNGDSLVLSVESEKDLNQVKEKVSYIKRTRGEMDPNYYKNPNTYKLNTGTLDLILSRQYGVFYLNNRQLITEEVTFQDFVAQNNGIVNAAWVKSGSKKFLMYFNPKNGEELKRLFDEGPRTVHSFFSGDTKILLGIDSGDETIEFSRSFRGSAKEDFETSLSNYEGKVTELLTAVYPKSELYEGIVLDNSIFVEIPGYTRISIGNKIKVGDDVQIKGFRKFRYDGEIRIKDYEIYYPTNLTIGKKSYLVKNPFRNIP